MITISLDENGHFESLGQGIRTIEIKKKDRVIEETTAAFIAGVVFDDKEIEDEYDTEKDRIEAYLKGICEDVCKKNNIRVNDGGAYPEMLHVNKKKTNGFEVGLVKRALSDTISEFLSDGKVSGNYEKTKKYLSEFKERCGEYKLYALVAADPDSIKDRELPGLLTEHRIASNLYVHMAEMVIERLVFHNPLIDVEKVNLELATRRYELRKPDDNKTEEYRSQGYWEATSFGGEKAYNVSNNYIYRTALEREKEKIENRHISVKNIMVEPIRYEKRDKELFLDSKKYAFLYLADIICSNLWWGMTKWSEDTPDILIKKKMQELSNGKDSLLFYYNSIDLYYTKAWSAYEEGDYYSSLYNLYEGKESTTGEIADYYVEYWYQKLIQLICKNFSPASFERALKRLCISLDETNLNQDRVKYIYKNLQIVLENADVPYKLPKELNYDYYDAGLTIYNHFSEYKKAYASFHECEKLASYVDVEKYLRTLNEQIAMLCDMSRFREAIKLGRRNLRFQRGLSLVKRRFIVGFEKEDLDVAVAEDQLAQVYSYLRDTKAEKLFKKSLSRYESEHSSHYMRTYDHLLHYYIEMDEKKKFIDSSINYFGGYQDLEKQFEYLVREGSKEHDATISLRSAMYVFTKGVFAFRMDELTDKFVERLSDLDKAFRAIDENALNQINGHPWELIYKYLALIMIEKGRDKEASNYRGSIESVLDERIGIQDKIVRKGVEEVDDRLNNVSSKKKRLTYMYN